MDKHIVYAISPFGSNCMLSNNPYSGIYEAKTSRTLDMNGGNPACNQGGIMILQKVIGFDMYNQQLTNDKSRTLKTPKGGDDVPVVFEQCKSDSSNRGKWN